MLVVYGKIILSMLLQEFGVIIFVCNIVMSIADFWESRKCLKE